MLLVDNFDSFTYNLVHGFQQLGQKVSVVTNSQISLEEIERSPPSSCVIGPGPGSPRDVPICLKLITTFGEYIPLLGVCLGHQAIGHAFGAHIKKAKYPMHGKASEIFHDGKALFANLPNPLVVGRYHSLIVDEATLPHFIEVSAWTKEGEIMAIRHQSLPIFGVQFHPDSLLTPSGQNILQNFLTEIYYDTAMCIRPSLFDTADKQVSLSA